MIQKIKTAFITLAGVSMVILPGLALSPAYAGTRAALCEGISDTGTSGISGNASSEATSCGNATNGNHTLTDILTTIVNIFSIIVGIVAVLMIIVGGFRYITSGGESSNVSGAKNTIIYAIVGLVIVALAQIIVRWVINRALGAYNGA